MLFKFQIYDIHEKQVFEDQEVHYVPLEKELDYKIFVIVLDIRHVRITGFRSYVLFDDDNNPTNCTKVFLSDGSVVFAKLNFDTFEKKIVDEYLTMVESAPFFV